MDNEDFLYNQYQNFSIIDLGSEFRQACWDGNLNKIEFFLTSSKLSRNVNIHYDDDAGLHNACSNHNLEVVDYLLTSPKLKEHADIHSCLDWPLSLAAKVGDLEIVKFLLTSPKLKDKANIHADDDYAFHLACANGHLEVVKYMLTSSELDEHAHIHPYSNYKIIIENGHLDILKFLLESKKLNVHAENDLIFISACNQGNLKIIQYLIFDLNIDVNENIKNYLKSEINPFVEKVKHMFEMRETNESLEKELLSDKLYQKKTKL
jgi:ankyrin repeat protein